MSHCIVRPLVVNGHSYFVLVSRVLEIWGHVFDSFMTSRSTLGCSDWWILADTSYDVTSQHVTLRHDVVLHLEVICTFITKPPVVIRPSSLNLKARLHVPCPSPSPWNLHCVNGNRPFDPQNGFCTYSVCQTVRFHWHNDKIWRRRIQYVLTGLNVALQSRFSKFM